MQKNKIQQKRGFTLLFAVLVSVLVLAVGSSIINLALKQTVLSGSSRDSQFAFYASNTGVDCVLFWETQGGTDDKIVFATSSESEITADLNSVMCANNIITNEAASVGGNNWTIGYPTETSAQTSFRIYFNNGSESLPYCVDVVVLKSKDEEGIRHTKINSYGYNTCDEDNPRRIERGLEVNI